MWNLPIFSFLQTALQKNIYRTDLNCFTFVTLYRIFANMCVKLHWIHINLNLMQI